MFIFRLINFIMGYATVTCDKEFAKELVNVMMKNEIDYWDMHRLEDGKLVFTILLKELRRLQRLCGKADTFLSATQSKGVPVIFKRYRKRIGIPIGIAIFSFILWSSTLFVWDIQVSGNEGVTDAEIIDELSELGCFVGAFIPKIDFYALCNRYVLEKDNVAWIAVNMDGTTAQVRVIESKAPDIESDKNNGSPTNLVASRDGYIIRIELNSGMAAVKPGQTVSKGKLLISGVNEVKSQSGKSFMLVRSEGKVFAETHREINVSVPLKIEEKTFTGVSENEKTLKIFGKTLKLRESSSILPENCDIIENMRRVVLFENGISLFGWDIIDKIDLPVYVITRSYNEYTYLDKLLTEEEALSFAKQMLAEKIEAELPDAEILTRDIDYEIRQGENGDELYLTCTLACVEDIAEQRLIGVK